MLILTAVAAFTELQRRQLEKKRELYIADETTKKWQVPIRIELEILYLERIKANVSYGFRKKYNCALNATQHVGYDYTLSYDFKNFFSSIKPFHVRNYISQRDISFLFVDNHLPQGLTTSPVVSNIAMIDFDETITKLLQSLNSKIIYTRYVDDINIHASASESVLAYSYSLNQT